MTKTIAPAARNGALLRSLFLPNAALIGVILSLGLLTGPVAAQTRPAGFRAVDGPSGGHLLTGPLPGVASTTEAFHAGLRRLKEVFGDSLDVVSAVRSKDNAVTTALFHAGPSGAPLAGMAIIAYAGDASQESILYDVAGRFPKTLPMLAAKMKSLPPPAEESRGHAAKAASLPALHPFQAPDHTVGISIPADWKVLNLGSGRVAVEGPNKEGVALNFPMVLLDANGERAHRAQATAQFLHTRVVTPDPLAPFTHDVAQDYTAGTTAYVEFNGQPDPQIHIDYARETAPGTAVLLGTADDHGQQRRFLVTVIEQPVAVETWMLDVWEISSPADEFAQVAPLMLAIEHSCRYNGEADRGVKAAETAEVTAAIQGAMQAANVRQENYDETSRERFEHFEANQAAVRDSMDRSTAGWLHILRDQAVISRIDNGHHVILNAEDAGELLKEYPDQYQPVPLSEYRKGFDY